MMLKNSLKRSKETLTPIKLHLKITKNDEENQTDFEDNSIARLDKIDTTRTKLICIILEIAGNISKREFETMKQAPCQFNTESNAYNLSNLLVIVKAMNGKLLMQSIRQGAQFIFVVPIE